MVLILFYAEELKRQVIGAAEGHARLNKMTASFGTQAAPPAQVAEVKENKRLDRAFKALISDGVITHDEYVEIKELIAARNVVAHEVHNLTADLSNERWARDAHSIMNVVPYDYRTAGRLEHWRNSLNERIFRMQRASPLQMHWLTFQAAERTFKTELKRLGKIINRQGAERDAEITTLNSELDLSGTELVGDFSPRHPYAHYDDGRLTALGVEICYRLFDLGKSSLAVAHLTSLSLSAVQHRKKLWKGSGGRGRQKVDLEIIPRRRFYARDEN